MVNIMQYSENFYDIPKENKKIIIYGYGLAGKAAYPYLKPVYAFCDKMAFTDISMEGIKVIRPEELQNINERMIIVICVKHSEVREKIKEELSKLDINADIFDFYNNIAFDCYQDKLLNVPARTVHYVRIVLYDNKGWILEKFANKMKFELEKRNIRVTIGSCVDFEADINHHIIYGMYEPISDNRDTIMITHIDSYKKVEILKHELKTARLGICMSRETMEKLVLYGVPRKKLCYINPAQDGIIEPKKFVLGITHRCYDKFDHRKRSRMLLDICNEIDPNYFSLKIMGAGWDSIVKEIKSLGFEIEYYCDFDYEKYVKLMQTIDYYLYWGFDEGSMGYLDALRAGVSTIVTPQGFHLDVKDGITYNCRTMNDFKNVLLTLQNKRKKIIDSVADWTWGNYTDKHLEVWNYILGNEEDVFKNQHRYEDGIFSVLRDNA